VAFATTPPVIVSRGEGERRKATREVGRLRATSGLVLGSVGTDSWQRRFRTGNLAERGDLFDARGRTDLLLRRKDLP
jgi:hypothetical protein